MSEFDELSNDDTIARVYHNLAIDAFDRGELENSEELCLEVSRMGSFAVVEVCLYADPARNRKRQACS